MSIKFNVSCKQWPHFRVLSVIVWRLKSVQGVEGPVKIYNGAIKLLIRLNRFYVKSEHSSKIKVKVKQYNEADVSFYSLLFQTK